MINLKGGQGNPLLIVESVWKMLLEYNVNYSRYSFHLRNCLLNRNFGKIFNLFTNDIDATFITCIQFQNSLTKERRTEERERERALVLSFLPSFPFFTRIIRALKLKWLKSCPFPVVHKTTNEATTVHKSIRQFHCQSACSLRCQIAMIDAKPKLQCFDWQCHSYFLGD